MRLGSRIFIALALLIPPSQAFACAVVTPRGYEGSAKQVRDVREAISRSTAIIDGEVVTPSSGGHAHALVYAHQVLKGSDQRWLKIGTNNGDSCAIELSRPGERMRMILSGGPGEYVLYRDQSVADLEDKVLGSDRRRDFPYFAGPRAPTK